MGGNMSNTVDKPFNGAVAFWHMLFAVGKLGGGGG